MVGFGSTLRLARRSGWEEGYLDYETLKLWLSQIEATYEEGNENERHHNDPFFQPLSSAVASNAANANRKNKASSMNHIATKTEKLMPYYAALISEQSGGLLNNVWGFIDATVRPISKPTLYQRTVYTGHKKCHALKYQAIATPDGFIAHLTGPFVGRDHDFKILHDSKLFDQFESAMPDDGITPIYTIYGDFAYPNSTRIKRGFRNPAPGSPEARFNSKMSNSRLIVEWAFKNILQLCTFLDSKHHQMIFKYPCAQF